MIKLSAEEIISLKDIKGIDKVAKINPLMQPREFEQLKISIATNGQRDAIILHRMFIVDGRNRYNALKALDPNGSIKIQKLPHKVSLADKKTFVNDKENRRMQTITQKTCIAVKLWNTDKPKLTQKEFVKVRGISQANFTNAQWIYKNHLPLIDSFIEGKHFDLGEHKTTDSLVAIVRFLKAEDKQRAIEPRDTTVTGLDKYDEQINKSVNYHLGNLISDLDNLNISDIEKAIVSKDIATQMYALFAQHFKNVDTGKKVIKGSTMSGN